MSILKSIALVLLCNFALASKEVPEIEMKFTPSLNARLSEKAIRGLNVNNLEILIDLFKNGQIVDTNNEAINEINNFSADLNLAIEAIKTLSGEEQNWLLAKTKDLYEAKSQKNIGALSFNQVLETMSLMTLRQLHLIKQMNAAKMAILSSTINLEGEFPKTWAPQTENTETFKLDESTDEYKNIVDDFMKSLGDVKIKKIHGIDRIQNKALYTWYFLKKQEIERKSMNNGNANEKWLYHASNSKYIPYIKREGLDPRLAKLTGSIGVGVYFSKSSKTTVRYVSEQDEIKQILYCRVAVGRSVKGKSGIRRPPYLFNTTELADSTHGEINNDKMWGIFDPYQSYPEYIIHLEMEPQEDPQDNANTTEQPSITNVDTTQNPPNTLVPQQNIFNLPLQNNMAQMPGYYPTIPLNNTVPQYPTNIITNTTASHFDQHSGLHWNNLGQYWNASQGAWQYPQSHLNPITNTLPHNTITNFGMHTGITQRFGSLNMHNANTNIPNINQPSNPPSNNSINQNSQVQTETGDKRKGDPLDKKDIKRDHKK